MSACQGHEVAERSLDMQNDIEIRLISAGKTTPPTPPAIGGVGGLLKKSELGYVKMLNDALITYNKTDEIKPQLALIADNVVIRVQTVAEYARAHSYSKRHVRLLCDCGYLPAIKVNGCWYIPDRQISKIAADG